MRQYDIVSGILLILSIIDFALAAPITIQEKRQARVDVAHIPRDAISALGKRGEDDLDGLALLAQEYIETEEGKVGSSDVPASSSSAALGPDHGPTNVEAPVPNPPSSDAHAPPSSAPNPAPSTANPDPLTGPSTPALSDSEDHGWWYGPEGQNALHKLLASSGHSSDHELSSAPPGFDHGSTNVVQAPASNPALPSANPNPYKVPKTWSSSSPEPAGSSEFELDSDAESEMLSELHGMLGWHAPEPNPNPKKRPSTDMNPDEDFDWGYWMDRVNQPEPEPALPKKFGQASGYQVGHVPQPDPVPSTALDFDRADNPVPLSWAHPASTSPGLPTNPEPHLDQQPSSTGTDSQPEDPEAAAAALYALKGKAKESRRSSGTARDVGNAAQRDSELLPDGRSLDPGSEFLSRP